MKAQLLSDIHSEFYKNPLEFLDSLEFSPNLDFLLLPGDLVVPCSQGKEKTKRVVDYFARKARHCIFTCGNHCYYYGTKEAAEGILISVMPSNFHWLRNSVETVDGIGFFGGAMWFPDAPHNKMYEDQLSDFLVIRGFKDWVYEENHKFIEAGKKYITDKTIVLTHHVPAYSVVAPVFQGDNLNRFFVCDMTHLILKRKPPLWVYGHTHLPGNRMMGETRIVANPYGYPLERKNLGPYPPVVFEI
jgi:predicted phosphodiesterase